MQTQKTAVKKELYKTILSSFSKKIKAAVEMGNQQVFLTVPTFVFGYPVFDTSAATVYLMRQLTRLGYTVTRYGDTEIYVTWKKEAVQEEVEAEDLPVFVNLRKAADNIRKNQSL